LHDLLRMETLYRDRVQSTLRKKKKLDKELVILFYIGDEMFVFRFQSRVMQNVEGDVQRLEGKCSRVLMCEAHEEDTVSDLRERVALVIEKWKDQMANEVRGRRDLFLKEGEGWRIVKEYDRLVTLVNT